MSNNCGGIGVLSLLGVLFVGLKLTGYIDWSWWHVTMSFWIGILISFTILFILALITPEWWRK